MVVSQNRGTLGISSPELLVLVNVYFPLKMALKGNDPSSLLTDRFAELLPRSSRPRLHPPQKPDEMSHQEDFPRDFSENRWVFHGRSWEDHGESDDL